MSSRKIIEAFVDSDIDTIYKSDGKSKKLIVVDDTPTYNT